MLYELALRAVKSWFKLIVAYTSVVLLTLFICSAVFGQSVAQQFAFDGMTKIKSVLSIPITSEPGKVTVEFPAVKVKDGKVPFIRFKAFIPAEKTVGWGPYLKIELNGKQIGVYLSDGSKRLLSRAGDIQPTQGKDTWVKDDNCLITFCGPVAGNTDNKHWYLLNVSDFVNMVRIGVDNRVESDGPNKLTFTNMFTTNDNQQSVKIDDAQIEDLSLVDISQKTIDEIQAASIKPIPPVSGKILNGKGYSLTVAKSGVMDLRIGKDRYVLSSAYSYPGVNIGYHMFTWENVSDKDWKTSLASDKKMAEIIVRGNSSKYSVTRRISLQNNKILVLDTIQNNTDLPLGLIVRYDLSTPKQLTSGQAYLSGLNNAPSMKWCSSNPTVYINQPNSSIGLVCEDTLMRLQLAMIKRDNTIQFGTEHFGLQPKKSHTIEMMIYPSKEKDYFSFINKVRNDWNVNFTVQGPFVFTDNYVTPGRTAKLFAIHPFYNFADGGHLTKEEYTQQAKATVQKLIATQPDAIPLGMIESNLVTMDRNKLPGTNITLERIYGYELNKAQTQTMEQNPLYGPWADSWPRTADGRAIIDTNYAYKPYLINMMTYPVIGNYQFNYMISQIDFMMDEIGFRGIYMDTFDIGYNLKAAGRPDYSKWDGHTVDLDGRGEIVAKYTDATLVGTPARAALIKHVLSKGGVVVTNGHSCAHETTGLPVCSFTETEWGVYGQDPRLLIETTKKPQDVGDMAAGHLSSPIGLGIRPTDIFKGNKYAEDHFAEILHKWVITCLKNGILYYYYESNIPTEGPGAGEYGVINYMYPFTPVELHEGWLVGQERTITAISGNYKWNHLEKPVCLVFDLKGKRVATPNVRMIQKGKAWQVNLKISDWNETAVIMSKSELK